MSNLEELKLIIRENDCPFFDDEELQYHLESQGSVKAAAYRCLVLKSENTTLSVSGLNCADTSAYFLRLAQMYRPNNSGRLKGG